MKKKVLLIALAVILVVGAAVTASAEASDFGSGAEVIASEVDMVKSGLIGKKISFSDGDFKSALCLADFESITVTKLPPSSVGALMLGSRRVKEGQTISRSELSGLSFMPASLDARECSFRFTVSGFASVGEIECTLKLIDRINYPPKASGAASEGLTRTQESIAVYGNMCASDPEGDEICYTVIAYPEHGILSSVNSEDGRFCYMPNEGYVGDDKFVYVARDSYGNYTKPVTVKLKVSERMSNTEYADMSNRPEYNAALAMTAMNVMNGRIIGDGVYFMPDEEVSRAEFLAMAMKCLGLRPNENGTATFFDDDKDIPLALTGYVSSAAEKGIANGDFIDGKLLFSPNEAITKYEAAEIIAKLVGISESDEEAQYSESSVPIWARDSVRAMYTVGIFTEEDTLFPTAKLTRAEAAGYLYRMLVYKGY